MTGTARTRQPSSRPAAAQLAAHLEPAGEAAPLLQPLLPQLLQLERVGVDVAAQSNRKPKRWSSLPTGRLGQVAVSAGDWHLAVLRSRRQPLPGAVCWPGLQLQTVRELPSRHTPSRSQRVTVQLGGCPLHHRAQRQLKGVRVWEAEVLQAACHRAGGSEGSCVTKGGSCRSMREFDGDGSPATRSSAVLWAGKKDRTMVHLPRLQLLLCCCLPARPHARTHARTHRYATQHLVAPPCHSPGNQSRGR